MRIALWTILGALIVALVAWAGVSLLAAVVPKPNDAELTVMEFRSNLVIDCLQGTVIYLPMQDGREFEMRCTAL